MDSFLKFLFAWWNTPLFLWSIETFAGLLTLLVIAYICLLIPCGIIIIILSIFDKEDK